MAISLTSSGINAGQAVNFHASSIPPGTAGMPRYCGGQYIYLGWNDADIGWLCNMSSSSAYIGDDNEYNDECFVYRLS